MLKRIGIESKNQIVIINLYLTANVRRHENTDGKNILRGVEEEWVISPMLFNIYPEHILRELLEDAQEGVILLSNTHTI